MQAVIGMLVRLAEAGCLPGDSEDEKLRKRTLVMVATTGSLAVTVWAAVYFVLGIPQVGMIPLGYIVISVASLAHFIRTKRAQVLRVGQALLILVLPFGVHAGLGGFAASSAVVVWSVLSPLGALMFWGRRVALLWMFGFMALLVVAAGVDSTLAQRATPLPDAILVTFFGLNVGVPLGILYFLVLYFLAERDRAKTAARELLEALQQRSLELEQQYTAAAAALRRLEDLNSSKDVVFKRLEALHRDNLPHLKAILDQLREGVSGEVKETLRQASREVGGVIDSLRPITAGISSERALRSKRLLLAESDVRQQIITKMALGGTGVELDIVSTVEAGRERLAAGEYDIICVDANLIELAGMATAKYPNIKPIFMTSENIDAYLDKLKQHPFLCNVVCRDAEDRPLTVKNITTTVSKLVNDDIFGLEKYLGWGVEMREHSVTSSTDRHNLISGLDGYLKSLGLRGIMTRRCLAVAEELLTNAIYDAPVDAEGKPLYRELPRTVPVDLPPEQRGQLRYACDGMLVGVSIVDPFGSLTKDVALEYLMRSFERNGDPSALSEKKGGAGRGLYQIIQSSSLVIFNVRRAVKTEVIALFNVDIQLSKRVGERSFHFFYEPD